MSDQNLQTTEKQLKPERELTMKQENFCREYVLCGNASEAYRRAYNSEKMKAETIHNKASSYLKISEIRMRIDELKNNLEELLGINKATEVKELIRIRNRCLRPEPVMEYDPIEKRMLQKEDSEGNRIWQFDSAGANSAQDKIFKALGYYAAQKQEITGKDGGSIKTSSVVSTLDQETLKNLPAEELAILKRSAEIQFKLMNKE